jgi:RNA polymerase sigma-70 factor, ECF subfamily
MHDHQQAKSLLSQEDFACLVRNHQHRLHVFLAGVLDTTEGAFDLVQDTFYEAWQAAQRGSLPFVLGVAEDEMQRWLFRAGYNNALSLLRRRRLIRWETFNDDDEPVYGYDDLLPFEEQLAEGEVLQAALAQMSQQDVACLLLRIVHGFSASETGQILGTTPDIVNNRLARAKRRLRAAYFQQNDQWERLSSS